MYSSDQSPLFKNALCRVHVGWNFAKLFLRRLKCNILKIHRLITGGQQVIMITFVSPFTYAGRSFIHSLSYTALLIINGLWVMVWTKLFLYYEKHLSWHIAWFIRTQKTPCVHKITDKQTPTTYNWWSADLNGTFGPVGKDRLTAGFFHVFSNQFPHDKVSLVNHILTADLPVLLSGSRIHFFQNRCRWISQCPLYHFYCLNQGTRNIVLKLQ